MRRKLLSLAMLAVVLAACGKSTPATTDSTSPASSPSTKTYAASDAPSLVLAATAAPGQTVVVDASTGDVGVDQWWLKGRADLLARWRELGYQGGFKRTFRVPKDVEDKGIAQLPDGVLSAISYVAIFKDAAAAQTAAALMGSSIKADLTANGSAPETVDATAFGASAFGLKTYLAKFKDYNAQYGWADGNAARAVVVLGTNAASGVALRLAQSLHA